MALHQIKLPPSLKIGDTPLGVSKYDSWSGTSGYYRRPETIFNPYKTDKMLSGGISTEDLKLNSSLCTSMRISNKSKVEVKRSGSLAPIEPKCLGKSNSMSSFIDQRSWSEILTQVDNYDSFLNAYNVYLCDKNNLISDNNEEGDIKFVDVKKVVIYCLSDDVPEFILDRFVELSRKFVNSGYVKWIDFRDNVLPKVVKAVQSECLFRRELPALLKLMNRPRIVDNEMGGIGDMTTNYRDNYNKVNDISLSSTNSFNFTKLDDSKNIARIELNNGTKVLYAGTVKANLQIPGYKGHIPRNVKNPKKFEHSSGLHLHPVDNNLRLTQKGMGCVLGYTGHISMDADFKERMTGCDPRTSTGAAYGPVRARL